MHPEGEQRDVTGFLLKLIELLAVAFLFGAFAAGAPAQKLRSWGVGAAVALPRAETERRWQATTYQWPILHGVLYGVSRDQFMAQHKANHIQVVYSHDAPAADQTLEVKAAMAHALGLQVYLCGTRSRGESSIQKAQTQAVPVGGD